MNELRTRHTNEVDPANDHSQPDSDRETRVTSSFFGKRGQAAAKPRPAPVGPQGQPLPAKAGTHRQGFIIIVAIALGLGGWILYTTARAASESPQDFKLGADTFEVTNNAKKFAASIEQSGPRLYQAIQGDKDLWITFHEGKWYAFQSWNAAKGRTCQFQWDQATNSFVDCDQERSFTPGTPEANQMTFFQTIEENNRLAVDLRTTIPPG